MNLVRNNIFAICCAMTYWSLESSIVSPMQYCSNDSGTHQHLTLQWLTIIVDVNTPKHIAKFIVNIKACLPCQCLHCLGWTPFVIAISIFCSAVRSPSCNVYSKKQMFYHTI
eukprot:280422_1